MLMPKIPSRQYARSSVRVVSLLEAHDILCATATRCKGRMRLRTQGSILVMLESTW